MECKVGLRPRASFGLSGINRNIVECKDFNRKSPYVAAFVLIETLWNVKMNKVKEFSTSNEIVLIETLWNVKVNGCLICCSACVY